MSNPKLILFGGSVVVTYGMLLFLSACVVVVVVVLCLLQHLLFFVCLFRCRPLVTVVFCLFFLLTKSSFFNPFHQYSLGVVFFLSLTHFSSVPFPLFPLWSSFLSVSLLGTVLIFFLSWITTNKRDQGWLTDCLVGYVLCDDSQRKKEWCVDLFYCTCVSIWLWERYSQCLACHVMYMYYSTVVSFVDHSRLSFFCLLNNHCLVVFCFVFFTRVFAIAIVDAVWNLLPFTGASGNLYSPLIALIGMLASNRPDRFNCRWLWWYIKS